MKSTFVSVSHFSLIGNLEAQRFRLCFWVSEFLYTVHQNEKRASRNLTVNFYSHIVTGVPSPNFDNMSCSLNSFKGIINGIM